MRGGVSRCEGDLEMLADEVSAAHLEPLQRLGEREVPLVRADANVELIASSMDIHVLTGDEWQAHHQDVLTSAPPHADRVVLKEHVDDSAGPLHPLAPVLEQRGAHPLAGEQLCGE